MKSSGTAVTPDGSASGSAGIIRKMGLSVSRLLRRLAWIVSTNVSKLAAGSLMSYFR